MVSNICMFGDSVSKGIIFDEVKKRYVFLQECFAHLISQENQISVSNYAKFGCTLQKGEALIERYKNELSGYDYTLLEFGGNDCDYNWAEVAANPFLPHQSNTPIEEFGPRYEALIKTVQHAGGHPVLLNLPPIHSARFFDWSSNGLNQENILAFLGDKERIFRWQASYNTIVEQLAKSLVVPLIDIRSAFFAHGDYDRFLCSDGIHPNQAGHLLITQAMEMRLTPPLGSPPALTD